jgi:hypothetical protein
LCSGTLPLKGETVICTLLPLHVVPARDRIGFRRQCLIEASQVELLKGKPTQKTLPSASGKGQVFWRCADCGVTVWSNYPQAGPNIHFIRVGTLDDPSRAPPDIHIYTSTKQPWVVLPEGVPAVAEFYQPADYWSAEIKTRFEAARAAAV